MSHAALQSHSDAFAAALTALGIRPGLQQVLLAINEVPARVEFRADFPKTLVDKVPPRVLVDEARAK